LKRAFLTEQDNVIRNTDMPERFQLRAVPVKETEEGELEEESEWIYKQAFRVPPVSTQVPTVPAALSPAILALVAAGLPC